MQRSGSDHAISVAKAALHLVPGGGALASLIDDYVSTSNERAIEQTMGFLAEQLDSIKDRIELNTVNKDEFADLLRSSVVVSNRSYREEKLRTAANILANMFLKAGDPSKSPYEELDHFMRCLDTLSIGALVVLGAVHQLEHAFQGRVQFENLHQQKFPNMDPALLLTLGTESNGLNLIHITEPALQTADYGNFVFQLTPIGKRFIERFIEGAM
jgi:hypothetical protein